MTLADLHARGKVRDIYEAGDDLLMVATDRVSAFDVVLPTPIPGKGQVLTGLSLHWFEKTAGIVANHVITADAGAFPPPFSSRSAELGAHVLLDGGIDLGVRSDHARQLPHPNSLAGPAEPVPVAVELEGP